MRTDTCSFQPYILFLALFPVLLASPTASPAAEPGGRGWFDQVERDRDRGAGRIEDEQTWELRRLREDRDIQMRRAAPRRELERLNEERDRRLQLDGLDRRNARPLIDTQRLQDSVILAQPPAAAGALMSPTAAQVSADERALAEAKDKLNRTLAAVDAAEQRALRSLKRRLNREGRAGEFEQRAAPVREYHQRLRAGHTADYQHVRSRILGHP